MKIAVLGANGFVGKNLVGHLSKRHNVDAVTRSVCNLLDPESVKKFLREKKYDVIVNAAAVYTNDDSLHDTKNNLGLFMNFYNNSDLFGKFINLGSGAEFDRQQDINCADETLIFQRLPADSYGFGQNIKARLCYGKNNFYTIRIFNCFGWQEKSSRIFPRFLAAKAPLEISNDRYFDYFSIQDLCSVVEHSIDNNWIYKDVNAVYSEKLKISEVLAKFCELNQFDKNFIVTSESIINYTGNADRLTKLDIPLNGLMQGLKEYIRD